MAAYSAAGQCDRPAAALPRGKRALSEEQSGIYRYMYTTSVYSAAAALDIYTHPAAALPRGDRALSEGQPGMIHESKAGWAMCLHDMFIHGIYIPLCTHCMYIPLYVHYICIYSA